MGISKKQTTKSLESNKQLEALEEQKNHNKFNSATEKKTPENQNQEHNVRKEGIGKMNQLR